MLAHHDRPLPTPPLRIGRRSQLEAFLVLRRNPLELWGPEAYEQAILPGRFLGRGQILLNDPDAIRHVLLGNHDNYQRSAPTRRVLRPILGQGLFLAEGEAWRHQRRAIAPSLAPRVMPILTRHILRVTNAALVELEARRGRPLNLLGALQRLTLDVAGQSMFSLEMGRFGADMRALMLRYALNYAKVGVLDLMLPPDVASPLDRGRAAFREDWLALIDRIIVARDANARSGDEPRDLLDLLRDARDPQTNEGFNHAQLRDEVSTLILAGHETTAVSLFWAATIAAMRPRMQERIAEEAQSVDLAAEGAVGKLRFTRAFLDETLRLYPPAYLIVREAQGPDEIAGHKIAPGTIVSISPWVLHRHHAHWHQPERFDPERFMSGAPPPDRMVYIPFGAGPRVCVGAQFALNEGVLVLASLLRRFKLDLIGTTQVRPRGLITTQPDRPVPFLLTSRMQ
ncbi:cytochrome P450 [Lichenicoccus sp.]|uniref:cytochrome P450 n=1 Tax=Lichenicoccus sp. TaxID=2781899 RepID=UPI003D15121B